MDFPKWQSYYPSRHQGNLHKQKQRGSDTPDLEGEGGGSHEGKIAALCWLVVLAVEMHRNGIQGWYVDTPDLCCCGASLHPG